MAISNTSEIAEILSNTVTDKIKFAYSLGTPPAIVKHLENQTNAGLHTPHNFYLKVLENWQEKNGTDASLAALIDILFKNNFKYAAGQTSF